MQELPVEVIDEALGSVLERPEFQPSGPSPLWRALGAAWDWTWARLGDLFEWLAPGLASASPAWSFAGRAVLVVLALVGLGVLVYMTRLWVGSLRPGRAAGRHAAPGAGDGPALTADEWEEQARAAAGEERWRDAVMALYQAVIHRLAQQDLLRLDPGKTPGDYRRELRRHARAAPLMERFVRTWEPVAFGRRTGGRGVWEELLGLARALGSRG